MKNTEQMREYMREYRSRTQGEPGEQEAGRPAVRMPRLGEKVAWRPKAFCMTEVPAIAVTLSGEITYINADHRYYTAEAECNGYVIHESFKY